MNEYKVLIKRLRESKRYSARRFLTEYPNNDWKQGCIETTVEFGCVRRVLIQVDTNKTIPYRHKITC